jgi:hypothetical protein
LVFGEAGIKYERHLTHFPRDKFPKTVADHVWLESVGRNDWIALTKDKRLRYLPLEREAIRTYKIRQFAFSSGTLSGEEMATILKDNIDRIFRFTPNSAPHSLPGWDGRPLHCEMTSLSRMNRLS